MTVAKKTDDGAKVWRRFEDVAFRNIDGECVIVPMRDSPVDLTRVFLLNRVGSHLWLKLENDCSEETLAKTVIDRFDVDEETAREDVAGFLENLLEMQLVEVVA